MLNALHDAASTSIPPETWRDLTVMIIDPNHYMRGIVADALRRLNIGSIISAPTADDAREAAHTIKPQIIIVDWAAGGMSGLEYTRSVRRNEQGVLRETPIILLASSVAHDQLIAARQSGINELLLKPVSVRAMKSRVEEVVLRPRKFIDSRHYVGPCRRRKQSADYYGPWRRLVDEPGIKQNPIRSPEDHSKLRAMVAQLTDYAVQDADDTRMVIR
ncbi:MAG: response regulator, partial [Pseudomonadota bacterium]